MKIGEAFRKAFQTFFRKPGETVKFWTVEACLTLACLAPALFLAGKETRQLALLAPVLYCLVMLPARVNAAGAMQQALEGGSLFSLRLGDTTRYGAKLAYGLRRCLLMLLWSAPLIAALLIAREHVSGDMDGFTLMRIIKDFGGGDLMTGVGYLALILSAALLLVLIGLGFHSGDRHALVLESPKLLRKRRGRVLGCWCCSLIILLPALLAAGIVIGRYLPVLLNLNALLMGEANLPSTRVTLIILAAGFVLTLPLLPLRSLVVAAYVNGWKHADENQAG